MPTGYTYKIGEGQSFEEFIWSCARAFGALIEMRDDPADTPIKMPEADSYYLKSLADAERKLAQIKRMTPEEAEQTAKKDYQDHLDYVKKYNNERALQKKAYELMLAKVNNWKPPTKDHEGLKKFMIQQIEESIKHDYFIQDEPEKPKSGKEWLKERIESAEDDVEYYKKQHAEETERIVERYNWIKSLQESVPIPDNLSPGK